MPHDAQIMMRCGYDLGYVTVAMAIAGGVGIVIPPSISMLIYGVFRQKSHVEESKKYLGGRD